MAIPRSEILKNLYAKAEAGRAHHRRRGRNRHLRQVRRGGRHRSHRPLQHGTLPHGRARLYHRPIRLWRRQRDHDGNGRRSPARREHTPVLAGVNATDPFRMMPHFLRQVKEVGFSGVQNFPTVGLFDGIMRENMEATGLGYDKEVEMIRLAHQMDLLDHALCVFGRKCAGHGQSRRRPDRGSCRLDHRGHYWRDGGHDPGWRHRFHQPYCCGCARDTA